MTRDSDPRGKYADTPIRARRMARCIGVSVRAGRVAGYVGVSVYRRCEGKSTPTRPSTRQIRRYADTPIRAGNTPIRRYAGTPVRRYADPGREGVSVYRCIGVSVRSCLRDAVCGLSATAAGTMHTCDTRQNNNNIWDKSQEPYSQSRSSDITPLFKQAGSAKIGLLVRPGPPLQRSSLHTS